MKKNQSKLLICLLLVTALAGCQNTSENTSENILNSPYYLSEKDILNSPNFDDLFMKWIPKNNMVKLIQFQSMLQQKEAIGAIASGFNRYCNKTKNEVILTPLLYGEEYSCKNSNGEDISIGYKRYGNNKLYIFHTSPLTRQEESERKIKKDLQEKEFARLRSLNGPSGTVFLEDGSNIKFQRLGDLLNRFLAFACSPAEGGYNSHTYVDKIKYINFKEDYFILRSNGDKKQRNCFGYNDPDFGEFNNFGIKGLPLVFKDKYGQQPYTKLFRYLNNIIAIEFDNGTNTEGGLINSRFNITPYKQALKAYFHKEANQLQSKRDWSIYIDPKNLSQYNIKALSRKLDFLSSKNDSGEFITGFEKGINYAALTALASEEATLLSKGYKISSELTPLSTFILLSEIERDLIKPINGINMSFYSELEARVKNLDL